MLLFRFLAFLAQAGLLSSCLVIIFLLNRIYWSHKLSSFLAYLGCLTADSSKSKLDDKSQPGLQVLFEAHLLSWLQSHLTGHPCDLHTACYLASAMSAFSIHFELPSSINSLVFAVLEGTGQTITLIWICIKTYFIIYRDIIN